MFNVPQVSKKNWLSILQFSDQQAKVQDKTCVHVCLLDKEILAGKADVGCCSESLACGTGRFFFSNEDRERVIYRYVCYLISGGL